MSLGLYTSEIFLNRGFSGNDIQEEYDRLFLNEHGGKDRLF